MEPEDRSSGTVLPRQGEAGILWIIGGLVFRAEEGVKVERLNGFLRGARIQNAGEVCEIVSHDGLLS
jgi:hypothetical protein